MSWEPPERWWCVNTSDECFRVDEASMASVVVAWNTGDRLVTFADVFGSTVTIPVENIESIWDSDRELRERGRLFLRAVDAEVPEWERGDE